LDKTFGLKCNFKQNYIESRFKVENGKFYPKIGEYWNDNQTMQYVPLDENEVRILTPEEMAVGLK